MDDDHEGRAGFFRQRSKQLLQGLDAARRSTDADHDGFGAAGLHFLFPLLLVSPLTTEDLRLNVAEAEIRLLAVGRIFRPPRQGNPRRFGVRFQRASVTVVPCTLNAGQTAQFLFKPLNELCRSNPSEVMSRYSISAMNTGSTHVALGFLSGLLSLLFGLTTVSSCLRIWLEVVRVHPVPTLPM